MEQVIDNGESIQYWKNNFRHREDGPAVIFKRGRNVWFHNGYMHRVDGPAVEDYMYGNEYWVLYRNVTDQIKKWANENDINLDTPSVDDKIEIKKFLTNLHDYYKDKKYT